jgi:hypothetical protein
MGSVLEGSGRLMPITSGAAIAFTPGRLTTEEDAANAPMPRVAPEHAAEAISQGLKIPIVSLSPEAAGAHFGWLAAFAGADIPASSALTQQWLGWSPTGPKLMTDLAVARDFRSLNQPRHPPGGFPSPTGGS